MSSKRAVVRVNEEGDEQGAHEELRNACEAANGHLAPSITRAHATETSAARRPQDAVAPVRPTIRD